MNARIQLASALSALLFVGIASACGSTEPSTARVVAAEGGTVIASTHRVTIPAASLPADTDVTLETTSADAYPTLAGALPEVLLMRPEGTLLERAATVTIGGGFIDADAAARVSIAQLATADGVSTWQPLESSRDATTGDVTLSVTRFAPLAVVVIETSGGTGIQGTIRWGDASPVAMAPIQLFLGTTAVTTVSSDAAGAFSFSDLAPGAYRIVVDYECMLDQAVVVTAGEVTTQDLVLCGG